jgi:hypothetical protein
MQFIRRHRLALIAIAIVVIGGAFLAFRPDKLFVDDAVDESLDDAFAAAAPADPPQPTTTVAPVSEVESDVAPSTTVDITTPTTQPAESSPTTVATGSFYGIDHSAGGTAAVYEQDGRFVLRFEDDTDIQNGPDLYVWILPDGDYDGGDPSDYLDLGKLKGNVGGQNYELPIEFNPELHQTVLIWCLRFGVPFAAAPLG